jgi:hypothetical protein
VIIKVNFQRLKHIPNMKNAKLFSAFAAVLMVSGGSVVAQEYDDVYFTPKDRGQAVYLTNEAARTNTANLVNTLKDSPMRSKFANPDYQANTQVARTNLPYFRKDFAARPSYFNGIYRNPNALSFVNGWGGWGSQMGMGMMMGGFGNRFGMGMNPMMGMGWGMDPWMMNRMGGMGGWGMNPMMGMGWGMDPWMMNRMGGMGWGMNPMMGMGWGMDPWMMNSMGWGGMGWGMNSMMGMGWGGMCPWGFGRPAVIVTNSVNSWNSTSANNNNYNNAANERANLDQMYRTGNDAYYNRNSAYGSYANSSVNTASYGNADNNATRNGNYDWGQGRNSSYNTRTGTDSWNSNRSSSSWGGSNSVGGGGGGGSYSGSSGGGGSYSGGGGRGGRGN